MCHAEKSGSFPEPAHVQHFAEHGLHGLHIGESGPGLAVLPDIYGCTPFYTGFAASFAKTGMEVFLIDPFHEHGPLPEVSREEAFARRHKVKDMAFVDMLEAFLAERRIGAVVGFCLGGLYVFDLVRRGYAGRMVAFYPFPQGLANQDPLPVPFDYLQAAGRSHTVLIGDQDTGLGPENTTRMREVAAVNPAIDLQVYAGSGHGFLADLDGDDPHRRQNAADALAHAQAVIVAQYPPPHDA